MSHQERPNTQLEQALCAVGILVVVAMAVRIGLRLHLDDNLNHTPEFLGLAALLALAGYLGWLLWQLHIVLYRFTGEQLLLQLGRRHRVIAVTEGVHLHHWRDRWTWSGTVERDLGVSAIALFPPVWGPWRRDVWVIVDRNAAGAFRATAFRPSAALLSRLRSWSRDSHIA
ncbi:MAG: hypothetical protein ACM3XM_15585 [Mycobacterium leprae]